MELDIIYNEDCLEGMRKRLPDESIDLVVTSPPYDNLRTYGGYVFKFEGIAKELFRVVRLGGVVIWVVGDATINGSETGTSFKQALYFKEIGFNLHDTMIWEKTNALPTDKRYRYYQVFEYMFAFSKGKIATFNPKMVKTVGKRKTYKSSYGRKNDKMIINTGKQRVVSSQKIHSNIFRYGISLNVATKDKIAFEHPAIFPEKLAEDHIISWSNEGDVVLDPMFGSGTTLKMAKKNNRHFIGFEINPEYCKIAKQRLEQERVLWNK